MSKPKKTLKISAFVDSCNRKLELATISQDEKSAICTILEEVLMNANQYAGFSNCTTLYDRRPGCEAYSKNWPSIPTMTNEEKAAFYKEMEYSRCYYMSSR